MFDFIPNLWRDLHPMIVHFALGGLFMSFGFTLLARVTSNAQLDNLSWILLLVGVGTAIPSAVTGIVSHLPYEALPVASAIEPHQLLGMLGTFASIGVVFWRFMARQRGKDIGAHPLYIGIAVIGLLWLFLLGGTGGNLVYQLGVNVRGINPLIK
ncbi:MAG: DUF2231 domain-containing protein [Chloroflexi bacterium]|nr:DUF2231 domain-containing protein [Chloroflexota bacterium]